MNSRDYSAKRVVLRKLAKTFCGKKIHLGPNLAGPTGAEVMGVSPWAIAQIWRGGGPIAGSTCVGAGPGPDRAQGGGAGPRDLRPHAEEE